MYRAVILLLAAVFFAPRLPASQSSGTALTIPQIQGAGATSPLAGQKLARPLRGCVTGVAAEGFFLQDPAGDGNPATSDGIYVYRYSSWKNPRGLKPGALVELSTYKVMEFYGQTELSGLPNDKASTYRVIGKCPLPAPVPIESPIPMDKPPTEQYEPLEGQRITIDFTASVVGPTQRYASRYPAGDPEMTLAPLGSPLWGARIFAAALPVDIGTITLTGGLGVDLPMVNTFDRIEAKGLTGILAYQFGRYVFLVENPGALHVTPGNLAPVRITPAGPDEWTACTFNAENLFDAVDDHDGDMGDWAPTTQAMYRANVARRAALIRDRLGGCTVLAVQEIEGKDAVWADLAQALGPSYRFDYLESADVRDITVGLIYDASRVELRHSASVQACSAVDYGVDDGAARGPRRDVQSCPNGLYPLYDRAPYMADVVVSNAAGDRRAEVRRMDVRLVVVHLKSKRGDEEANAPRRVQQARQVAAALRETEARTPLAITLGDFNDDLSSEPVGELRGLVNLYERHAPPADRYSYIYNGRAQAVDHIAMTPQMDAYYLDGGPAHVNADYAEPLPGAVGRTSDHDPLVARFGFQPTGISEGLLGAAAGALGAGYHQPIFLK